MRTDRNERKPSEAITNEPAVKRVVAAGLNDLTKPSTPSRLASSLSPEEIQDPVALIETEAKPAKLVIGLHGSERLARGLAVIDDQLCAEIDAEVARMRASGERPDPSQFRDDGPDPFGIDYAWAGGKLKK